MTITKQQWLRILAVCGVRFLTATRWAPVFYAQVQPEAFSRGMLELPDFLGQVLHETELLEELEENLHYSARRIGEIALASAPGSRWRELAPRATELAMQPARFAEAVYGGRMGNCEAGDGWKYRGRGIPMITGRDNYACLAALTGLPLLEHPDMLCTAEGALRCGILWWERRIPDTSIGHVELITKAVQGGGLGLPERTILTNKAARALAELEATV